MPVHCTGNMYEPWKDVYISCIRKCEQGAKGNGGYWDIRPFGHMDLTLFLTCSYVLFSVWYDRMTMRKSYMWQHWRVSRHARRQHLRNMGLCTNQRWLLLSRRRLPPHCAGGVCGWVVPKLTEAMTWGPEAGHKIVLLLVVVVRLNPPKREGTWNVPYAHF